MMCLYGVPMVRAVTPAPTPVARYSSMTTGVTAEQADPLNTVVVIHFPQQVQTVGEAMSILLLGSGYQLDPINQKKSVVQTLFAQPLPVVDRTMGPMTITQGITTLMGPAYQDHVEPVTRFIAFHLKSAYVVQTKPASTLIRRAHAQPQH